MPDLASLPVVSSSTLSQLSPPTLKIHTEQDVEAWHRTSGYQIYGLFLRRLNSAIVGYEFPLEGTPSDSEAISKTISMLDELENWIGDIPPEPTPQRFGNMAFRKYGNRLEERSQGLLETLLPHSLHAAIPFVKPYLVTSLGSFQRLDYGTGHETSFAIFLLCLTLLRFYTPEPDEERNLVLRVFERYLRLVWRLQDVYRLEPAGSHGVWGLDDYGFLGYLFGSGQLRDRQDTSPAAILDPLLPPTNLYHLSIIRIHQLKHGPFHEHSPQLHSIAQGVAKWSKVNSGMFKMYEAEVLHKRVVVQHIPLGGLLPWDAATEAHTTKLKAPVTNSSVHTPAPWASTVAANTVSNINTTPSLRTRGEILPPSYLPRR